MKKYLILFITLLFSIALVLAVGIERIPAKVIPSGVEINVPQKTIDSSPVIEERIIVPTTSEAEKASFKLKGCKILHELNDATALKCPKTVKIPNAKPDRILHLHDLEADIQINADSVWNLGYEGTAILVAILDTGIDTTHIELADSILETKNFINGPGFDSDGHGSHVSGIVTANGIYQINNNYATGVAPSSNIIVGKVCGNYGCHESDIMAGIEWAVAKGANILSMSLGTPDWHTTNENCDLNGGPIVDKVNWAVSQGLFVVISAGNEGDITSGVSSPACASGAVAVGAVDKTDNRPIWSSYGPALDLVAPGVDILSTYSCKAAGDCKYYWYAYMSGTSQAAPHVAGTAALILQKNPTYTIDEIKQSLYKTALDLGAPDYDQYYGYGRVDALAAVNYQFICTINEDCTDNNECTIDKCENGTCYNTPVTDNTPCASGICCSGTCSLPKCSSNIDCDDGNSCTINTCNLQTTCNSYCTYTEITQCIDNDGCCPLTCTQETDNDCTVEEICGDKYCAGYLYNEDCFTCPQDCRCTGKNCGKACCGDSFCVNENIKNCPVDCS